MSARTKDKAYKVLTRIIENIRDTPLNASSCSQSVSYVKFSQDQFGELLVSGNFSWHIHPNPECHTTEDIIEWLYSELTFTDKE